MKILLMLLIAIPCLCMDGTDTTITTTDTTDLITTTR